MRFLLLLLAVPAVLCEEVTRTNIGQKLSIPEPSPVILPDFNPTDIFGSGIIEECGWIPFPPCPMIGCPVDPCPEGQICKLFKDGLRCIDEKLCTKCIDFCLVIDTSGSIGTTNFPILIDFLKNLVDSVIVGREEHSIFGAARFDDNDNENNCLWTFSDPIAEDANAIMAGLMALQNDYINNYDSQARTCIGCGLIECGDKIFYDPANRRGQGDTPNCPDVMIVITDGRNNEQGDNTVLAIANAVKFGLGATLATVGIGDQVDAGFLQQMASPGAAFLSDDFNGLENLIEGILNATCVDNGGPK